MRSLLTVFTLFLLACGDDASATDAGPGTDGGADAAQDVRGAIDTGADTGTDSGIDAGPTGCTEGCDFVELAGQSSTTCARRENGEIICWGSNTVGQVGDGEMSHEGSDCRNGGAIEPSDCPGPVKVKMIDDATQVSSNIGPSACARRESGDVFCWGLQALPDVVGGANPERFTPVEIEAFAGATDLGDGYRTTCAVVAGNVWCVWENESGQLGVGDITERRDAVMIPGLTDIIDVEVSPSGTACARSASTLYCWGNNDSGQLGDGPEPHDRCMIEAREYDCSLTPLPITTFEEGTSIEQITIGRSHVCALTGEGTVLCWGSNAFGQLGIGDRARRDVPTMVDGLLGVAQIRAGRQHTCALLESGEVRCWGRNEEGTIGDGMLNHGEQCSVGGELVDCIETPQAVSGIDNGIHLSAGSEHNCVVRADQTIWCWGFNSNQQLGNMSRERSAVPVMVMGLDAI